MRESVMGTDKELLYRNLAKSISEWIKEQSENVGFKNLIVGVSGGIDSAVVAGLCSHSGEKTIAMLMPDGEQKDKKDAISVCSVFNIPRWDKDISKIKKSVLSLLRTDWKIIPGGYKLAEANLKARIRMICLYYMANLFNGMVVGTDNADESYVGYFTKWGDGAFDINPLGNLCKCHVYGLAEVLGVPQSIIDKAPSAGLWDGQTDEQEMGFSYEDLDQFILCGENRSSSISQYTIDKMLKMNFKSYHKRVPAPVYEPKFKIRGE